MYEVLSIVKEDYRVYTFKIGNYKSLTKAINFAQKQSSFNNIPYIKNLNTGKCVWSSKTGAIYA